MNHAQFEERIRKSDIKSRLVNETPDGTRTYQLYLLHPLWAQAAGWLFTAWVLQTVIRQTIGNEATPA